MTRLRLAVAVLALSGCKQGAQRKAGDAGPPPAAVAAARAAAHLDPLSLPPAPEVPPAPLGLPPAPSPEHNPTTPAKVALGRLLFFEPRLAGGSTTCAGCHDPYRGFADATSRSMTASGQQNLRHTPTLYNVAYATSWYWDGSMPTLEALVLSNWRGQMAADPVAAAARLAALPLYQAHFRRAFDAEPSPARVAEALAAFLRTIGNGDAPWDRHEAGQPAATTAAAIAGAQVFTRRAGCASCHVPPLYSDGGFHARLPTSELDPGRMRVTADPADRGAFRTPSLRGAADSAPYFHDGSAATLEDAVDLELARDSRTLGAEERDQLIAFLRALSPPAEGFVIPALP